MKLIPWGIVLPLLGIWIIVLLQAYQLAYACK